MKPVVNNNNDQAVQAASTNLAGPFIIGSVILFVILVVAILISRR